MTCKNQPEAVLLDKYGWFAPESLTRHNAPSHAFREYWQRLHGPESWNAKEKT